MTTTTATPAENTTAPTTAPEAEESINLNEIAASVRETAGLKGKESPGDDADAMAATVDRYADEAIEPPAEGVTFNEKAGRYQDAQGRFVAKDGTPEEAASATAPPEAEAPPAETAPPETPTTDTADPAKGAPKPAPFVAYGTDGQPLPEIPVKEWEIKVNGEMRKLDTEKLVRLAQSGGYNEELHVHLKQLREYTPQVEQYAQALEQRAQEMEQYVTTLLRDPNLYVQESDRLEQAQTPEAEAERLRQENAQYKAKEAQQTTLLHLAQATEHVLGPKMEQLIAQYPEVSADELVAHLNTLVAPYRQPNGLVHPTHLPAVAALLDRAVTPYAAQLHEARSDAKALKAAQEAHAKAAEEAAQRTAQEAAAKAQANAHQQVADAKRHLARQIAPSGGVSTSAPARPKPTSFNDTRAQQRAVEDAVNAVLGG